MEKLKIHYSRQRNLIAPELGPGEEIVWSGAPNRWEYFWYWLPRSALPALLWSLCWSYAAFRQFGPGTSAIGVAIPTVLAMVGGVLILALPIVSMMARRFVYLITSRRIIIFDKLSGRMRSINIEDIDRFKVIKGWLPSYGSLVLSAGTAETPDGTTRLSVTLVGINDVFQVKILISKKGK